MRLTPLRWMEAIRRSTESLRSSVESTDALDVAADQAQLAALDVRALIAMVGAPNRMSFRGNYDPIRLPCIGHMDVRR